ncbi:MAG: terminase TerL endonuclease subunit [Candidatus Acidiferrum sp.]
MTDFVAMGRKYAGDVIAGRLPACQWIKLACQRSQRDLARQEDPAYPYRFDEKRAQRVCQFVSSLKHVKDSIQTRADERIVIQPWQAWVITEIFGWVWKDSGKRRYRRAFVNVPRGNGKSTLTAGISLFAAFAESVGGSECVCAASNADQARIVLDTARQMLLKDDRLRERLGAQVLAHKIVVPRSNSVLRGLPSKSSSVEGLSISFACLDELHAQRGRQLHDTLSTGTAKREESLFFLISTAGDDSAGICFEITDFCQRVLQGISEDESFFCALYTIDATDSWDAPSSWEKANPNWGISVDPKAIAEEAKRAQQIPASRPSFQSKHLNVFVSSGGSDAFLTRQGIQDCYDPTITDKEFEGSTCTYGVDLASTLDLCTAVRIHSRRDEEGKEHLYAFCGAWLNEVAVKNSRIAALRGWQEEGWLTVTPKASTDLDTIEAAILADHERFHVRQVCYDKWQGVMMAQHLEKHGLDPVSVANFALFQSVGMNYLQQLVAEKRLHFNSPVLKWCLENLCVSRSKISGLIAPVRNPKDRELKVDCAVALIYALGTAYAAPLDAPIAKSPYEERGILFLDERTGEVTIG